MICTISLSRCSTLRPASLPQTVRNTACCSPSGVTCKISQPLPCCRKSSAGPLFQSRRAIQVSQQASCRAGLASECTSAIGLQLWRISGDGSCLFRALAQGHHQLTHTGESLSLAQEKNAAAQLRQDVCKEIRKRKDDIEPFLETDVTSYLAHMSRSSTWGGEPELSVALHCLQRPVAVYMYGATGLQVMSTYTDSQYEQANPVKVLFNGIGHYDLLVSRQQTSKL